MRRRPRWLQPPALPGRDRALDVVAIGASAGGLDALKTIVSRLPSDFGAAVLVTLHLSPHSPGVLPWILSKAGPLPAEHPEDGDPIQRDRIYVAPPDRHLLARGERLHLSAAGRENGQRQAVGAMFRSVARSFGSRAVGLALSG